VCFKQLKNDNGFPLCKLNALLFVSSTSLHHLKTENERILSSSSETKPLVIKKVRFSLSETGKVSVIPKYIKLKVIICALLLHLPDLLRWRHCNVARVSGACLVGLRSKYN
jgi:hypothetical protein